MIKFFFVYGDDRILNFWLGRPGRAKKQREKNLSGWACRCCRCDSNGNDEVWLHFLIHCHCGKHKVKVTSELERSKNKIARQETPNVECNHVITWPRGRNVAGQTSLKSIQPKSATEKWKRQMNQRWNKVQEHWLWVWHNQKLAKLWMTQPVVAYKEENFSCKIGGKLSHTMQEQHTRVSLDH